MRSSIISMAAVSDPYRPKDRMPKLPEGFSCVGCEVVHAAAFILRRSSYDICPLMVAKWVVGIFCQSRGYDFVLVSAYAPPHKPMEHTLGLIEEIVARSSSANIVLAGDFNAKHQA